MSQSSFNKIIFVYGTLRIGQSNDMSNFPDTEYLGEDTIKGDLLHLGWYPGANNIGDSENVIRGDVFMVYSEDTITALDAYEGAPTLFKRIPCKTGKGLEAEVYEYQYGTRDDYIIEGGDFSSFVETERRYA